MRRGGHERRLAGLMRVDAVGLRASSSDQERLSRRCEASRIQSPQFVANRDEITHSPRFTPSLNAIIARNLFGSTGLMSK